MLAICRLLGMMNPSQALPGVNLAPSGNLFRKLVGGKVQPCTSLEPQPGTSVYTPLIQSTEFKDFSIEGGSRGTLAVASAWGGTLATLFLSSSGSPRCRDHDLHFTYDKAKVHFSETPSLDTPPWTWNRAKASVTPVLLHLHPASAQPLKGQWLECQTLSPVLFPQQCWAHPP